MFPDPRAGTPRTPTARPARRQGAMGVVLAGLLVVLAACSNGSGSGGSDGPVQKGGTLTIGSNSEPLSLDPSKAETQPATERPLLLAFQRLVDASPTSHEVVPGLASKWAFDKARTKLTFNLGEGTFANGDRVTAADVKFSLDRLMDPEVDPDFATTFTSQIKSVEAPDEKTVVLNLQRGPQPDVLDWLTMTGASIISEKAFKELGAKKAGVAPTNAGSGPYNIMSFERGQQIVLERNPHWQGKEPNIDKVVIKMIPNDNTRMLAVRSGQIDIAEAVPYPQIQSIKKVSSVEVKTEDTASVFGPWIASEGPTAPAEVRKALLLATPFKTIQKVAFAGTGQIPNSTVPPLRYWDKTIAPVKTDLAEAKALMAESPTPHGFSLEMLVTSGDSVALQTAQILQQSWKKIGVKLSVRPLDQAALYQANIDGNWQAILFGPGSAASHIPSESEFYANWANPVIAKFFKYKNPELVKLMGEAAATSDETEREKLYSQIQRTTLDNLPWLPFLFDDPVYAVSKKVHDFGVTPLDTWNLSGTWVSK